MNEGYADSEIRYKKQNGCTKKPSLAMLFTIFVVIVLIVLHALIIKSITEIDHAILTLLLAFNYVTLFVVAIDYFILLLGDPVDPRLLINHFQQTQANKKLLVYCTACQKNVHVYSYHCKVCNRCADEFDHHCIFLNNCIGRKNYANFFRVLLTFSMFLAINIGQGIWVAIRSQDPQRGLGVALAVSAGLVLPEVMGLMIFHCYISLCLYKTTLQYIRGELEQDKIDIYQPGQSKKKNKDHKIDTETSINRHHDM